MQSRQIIDLIQFTESIVKVMKDVAKMWKKSEGDHTSLKLPSFFFRNRELNIFVAVSAFFTRAILYDQS